MPTVKWDGTAVLVWNGVLYKRYTSKRNKLVPSDFVPTGERDPQTGKLAGWVPVGKGTEDQWHREAATDVPREGTYELVGPKVQGNPYRLDTHRLVRHGEAVLDGVPLTYASLREYLGAHEIEGIVWWRTHGPVGKIKRRDFGLPWPIPDKESQ